MSQLMMLQGLATQHSCSTRRPHRACAILASAREHCNGTWQPSRPTSTPPAPYIRSVQVPQAVSAAEAPPKQLEAPPQQQQPPPPEQIPVDGVDILPVSKHTTLFRGVCSTRLKYEVEYGLKRGTTDNSYTIQEGKDLVIVDVPDGAFKEHFVKALSSKIKLQAVNALVLTHLTPKRIPTLIEVLKHITSPDRALKVYLSNPAMQLLRSSLGKDDDSAQLLNRLDLSVARAGGDLSVGQNKLLTLIPTPTPRWPDLLCAYSPSQRLLFTSKLFAAHVAPSAVGAFSQSPFDQGGWSAYGNDWRYYFDCMLAPVARQATGALDRLEVIAEPAIGQKSVLAALRGALKAAQDTLEGSQAKAFGRVAAGVSPIAASMRVTALLPLHGPVVASSMAELLRKYREWAEEQVRAATKGLAAVFYASAYGNTAALAQAISRGVTKAGVAVEAVNLETETPEAVNDILKRCQGFAIGSPTLGGHMPTQVTTALGSILREETARELPCGVFGSFGWSGEAVDELQTRLSHAGFSLKFDPVKVKFKPSAKDMQIAEESGTDLAQAMLKRQRQKSKQSAGAAKAQTASAAEQAVGRVLGSLCVVTARDGDAQSAMLASWISQASFEPPGLSVSVKKDRAVENLMAGNNTPFIINVVASGKEKAIMKQMTRSFKPGEDRFAGLDTQVSEENGCVILPDIAAYLECTVVDRMEAGDHWVVYGRVDGGKVMDESAIASVHHRKTGTTY